MDAAVGFVRPIERGDLAELVSMCVEHARYERAAYDPIGKAASLERAVFGAPARLVVWVAETNASLAGYASASSEFSTWLAGEFLQMDCLFVREAYRGAGIGAALLATCVGYARRHGYAEVQWQTPDWNFEAERFYLREGAFRRTKSRFFLSISPRGALDPAGH